MTSRDFCYWLQGFFETAEPIVLNEKQVQIIKNHLNLVFHHEIDKQYKEGDGSQQVHDGKTKIETPPIFNPDYDWPPQKNHPNDGLLRC